jgi:hypothetical protein
MTEPFRSARYITVSSPSDITNKEWIDQGRRPEDLPGPVYRDYALMKVLYMLRFWDKTSRVHAFKWEDPLVPLDFSSLQDSDWIYIAGHGDPGGLYALGPDRDKNTDRLVEILTKDGNLKNKRKDKPITILLLSCRAGLGLHKVLARKLFDKLGGDVIVGGAKGFTFGSVNTGYSGYNDVLIKGLPWYMEYPLSIARNDAEKETSAREGKTITYKSKRKEILKFKNSSEELQDRMKDLIKKLTSIEVNNALDEIEKNSRRDWEASIMSQAMLYTYARNRSNLEFDMWYPNQLNPDRSLKSFINDAYVWINGKNVTDQEVNSFLKGLPSPSDLGLTSIK